VRKFAYFDYYFKERYGSFDGLSDVQKFHLSHCLNIVLQTLLCQPSMGTVTHRWVETQDYPYPDFDIQRKCVNHDAILRWQKKNNVGSDERWKEITPPQGAYIYPASPELLAWESQVTGYRGHVHSFGNEA
jgi:hypothetical protein